MAVDVDKIVWSDDVEPEAKVGDLVRGKLELTVVLPEGLDPDTWLSRVDRAEIAATWNKALEAEKVDTRVSVVAFRKMRAFVWTGNSSGKGAYPGPGRIYQGEVDVVGRIEHNGVWLFAVMLILAAYIVGRDVAPHWSGGHVVDAKGGAIGAWLGDQVGAFGERALNPFIPVLLIIALWGLRK